MDNGSIHPPFRQTKETQFRQLYSSLWRREGEKKGERTKQEIGHDVVKKLVGGKKNLEGVAFFWSNLRGEEMRGSKSTTLLRT